MKMNPPKSGYTLPSFWGINGMGTALRHCWYERVSLDSSLAKTFKNFKKLDRSQEQSEVEITVLVRASRQKIKKK